MERDKRETMELNIEDPAFSLMRIQLSGEIKKAVAQMEEAGVEEADVSVKIKIGKSESFVPSGEIVDKLKIDYKITRSITLKEQADGDVTELDQYAMVYDAEGNLFLRRIEDPQHKIDEYF